MADIETGLLVLGLVGQGVFASRFLVQWIVSERRQESVIPVAFWYLSLGGAVLLFTYAWLRGDPVFMLGQATGSIVYVRNLILIRRKAKRD
ncbi:MAG: lipid-A-disaccharide synthase N-terminal domain-containing protein [Longimicrobiales bacterium]